MPRFALIVLLALAVVHCYGEQQVQMPDAAELQDGNDLQSQIKDLQRNVTDIWTYIHELRDAVSNHLNHLRQHQVVLESSMHKMEHLHESEMQSSSDYHHHSGEHSDDHHSHSGEQHSHGGEHSHSGDHHSHGDGDHHSHGDGDHHSHGDGDHHSHGDGDHHSHGDGDHHSHGDGDHHSHDDEHHSHGDDHGHYSHSHSHSHSATHDHSGEGHSHGEDHDHHQHGQTTDSVESEDFQQRTQQEVVPPPVSEPVVVASDRRSHSHHHHSSRTDGMNLMNENSLHSYHHHHHHDSSSRRRNRTVEIPKYTDYGLYYLAMCDVTPNRAIPEDQQQNVVGSVTLWQKKTGGPVNFHVQLQGFDVEGHHGHHQQTVQQDENNDTPQIGHKHGFHIHSLGDLSNGCQSTGPHYNPKDTNHGGPNQFTRHLGDLGMISCDDHGNTNIVFSDDVNNLRGPYSIIGKSLVIHALEDDLGQGGNEESLKTGNSGTRIACCLIRRVDKIPMRQYRAMKYATQRQNR